MRLRIVTWIGVIAGLAVLGSLAACSSDDNNSTSGQGGGSGTNIQVSEKEYSITPDKTTAPAGPVTFTLKNNGTMAHEFVVLKTDLDPASLPQDAATGTVDEEAPGITSIGEEEEFDAGLTKTFDITLDAGKYVLICNIAGHYQLGMHTAFTVN